MRAADSSLAPTIAAFRKFNRAYTRFLGTLSDRYLHTEFSLAEGRVLYEVATRSQPQAKEIAEALGLDAGYLSRILSKFEKAGLVVREASKQDKRAANLQITDQGRAAIRTLDLRANRQARDLLGRLSAEQRTRFAGALRTVEQTVLDQGADPTSADPTSAEPAPIVLRTHRAGDMGKVVELEGAGYAEQYGLDQSFEELVARIVADFLAHYDPVRERCWIADMEGQHVGHIFLMQHPEQPDVAKLRLLYVDPTARGRGLGQRLVAECIGFARGAGYRKITLWTQSLLTPAIRIYQAAGFELVREEKHRSFGKDLIGQTWEMDLA